MQIAFCIKVQELGTIVQTEQETRNYRNDSILKITISYIYNCFNCHFINFILISALLHYLYNFRLKCNFILVEIWKQYMK